MSKPPYPPLVPRPIVSVIALTMAGAIVYNIHLDAASSSYSGAQVNYLLTALIAAILGVDLRMQKRRREEDERDDRRRDDDDEPKAR